MKRTTVLNTIFIAGVIFAIAIFPFLMFATNWWPNLGLEHASAVIMSFFAIYIISRNKTVKRYFPESYEYLYIAMILFACIHFSEFFTEIIFAKALGEYQETVGLVTEHLFFYLAILSTAYAFFKIEEPSIEDKAYGGNEDKK